MRPILITLALAASASPALAHPGHLADYAGHDHWVAGAAIGLAIALGLWGALKGGKSDADEGAEPAEDQEA